jgi:hypothetical protein
MLRYFTPGMAFKELELDKSFGKLKDIAYLYQKTRLGKISFSGLILSL